MISSIITVLLSIFFALLLGWFSGKTNFFKSENISVFSTYVMEFAFPAALFIGTLSYSRKQLMSDMNLFWTILIAELGLYIIVILFSRYVFKRDIKKSAIQALLISWPSISVALPVFNDMPGPNSILTIVICGFVGNLFLIPVTLFFINPDDSSSSTFREFCQKVINIIKKPIVSCPFVGLILVFIQVDCPEAIFPIIKFIGDTAAGVAIFMLGLIISSVKVRIDKETIFNVLMINVVSPAIGYIVSLLFKMPVNSVQDVVILSALPAAFIAPTLASHYGVYREEATSSFLYSVIFSAGTLVLTFCFMERIAV